MRRAGRLLAAICIAVALGAPAARAIGGQFGLEFAIDAPWRLEPIVERDGRLTYPAIPIFVTFNDAVYEQDRGTVLGNIVDKLTVGRLKEVRVLEIGPTGVQTTVIAPSQLYEIERKEKVSTKTGEPPHQVCRPAPGQDCADLLDITNTHEWHAMFWYTPKAPMTPGGRLHMTVDVITNFTFVEMRPSSTGGRSGGTLTTTPVPHQLDRTWTNRLVVVAGEKPLPRFGDQWLYGDLHYHGQMSDNEGEVGYAYRNVVRAMGALGMDFAFATDHASNGVHIAGKIDKKYCADASGDVCFEARDLNGARFAAAKSILYGPDGANEAVARDAQRFGRARSAGVLPQLYMGEELDAWPEMSAAERNAGAINYGDGLRYLFSDVNDCIQRVGLAACNDRYSSQYIEGDRLSYLVSDEQGIPADREIDEFFGGGPLAAVAKWIAGQALEDIPDPQAKPRPSRQHLVYFPNSAAPNGQGWIGSDTGTFGGAGKKLADVVKEIEANGFAFLAHPLLSKAPGKTVAADIAPAEAPYSEAALMRAWRSPAILGLQFWNENDMYKSERLRPETLAEVAVVEDKDPAGLTTVDFLYVYPWVREGLPWRWEKALEDQKDEEGRPKPSTRMWLLYHGAFTWDRFLRKGLDLQQTASISWLRRGEPRKWFMSGGSDGHGDFNFRRSGRPCFDSRWCDKPVNDTAIGNPRNLVDLTPEPASGRPATLATDDALNAPAGGLRRYTNTQVLGALRAGKFSVTDGPAIRIVVDRNRDGAIDPGDFQMGSTFDFYPGEHIPLLVEWISTVEFGPVTQIDLYVGNSATTYAPVSVTVPPGPDFSPLPAGSSPADRYAPDPSQALRINVASVDGGYRGVAKVFLGPAQFGLASADGSLSYVRAVARTVSAKDGANRSAVIEGINRLVCPPPLTAGNKCGDRIAYSNPIWGRYRIACPGPRAIRFGQAPPASTSSNAPFIDADGNSVPDTCERDIPDPCPATSNTRLRGETPFSGGARPGTFQRNPNVLPSGPTPGKAVPTRSCQTPPR